MKRGADRQISKDDADDGETEEVGQGLVRADENTLKSRKIRGLPKRAMNATPPPSISAASSSLTPATLEPDQTPKFASFSGFGASSSSSTPFASGTPIFGSSQPTSSTLLFGSSNDESKPASTAFSSLSTPPLASNASQATKTFASAFNTASTESSQPAAASKSHPPERDDPELWYYMSLRGLNESLRRALAKAIDIDPFVDMSDVFEQYKTYRAEAQAEFDSKLPAAAQPSSSTGPTSSFGNGPTSAFSSSSATTSAAKPSPSMPAAPTGFAGFSAPTTNTPSSSKPGEGFKPIVNTSSTGSSNSFGWSSHATNGTFSNFGSGDKLKPNGTDTSSTTSQPPLAFGSSSASKSPDTASPPPPAPESRHTFGSSASRSLDPASSPFKFGESASNSSAFTFGSPSPDSKGNSDASPSFSSAPSANLFGATGSKVPGSTSSLWDKPSFSPSSTSSTGAAFGSTGSTGSAFGVPHGSPGNGFGSGSPSTPSIFGSSSTQHTNPLGSSKASTPSAFTSAFASSSNAFKSSTPSTNFFGSSNATPSTNAFDSSGTTPSTNIFGSTGMTPSTNTFSSSSTPSLDVFGQPIDTESNKDKDSSTSNVPVFGKTSEIGTPEKPTAASAFSTPPPKPLGGFGGFGKPVGSIGNPMGYGFGSPPKTPDAESASNTFLLVPPASKENDEDTADNAGTTPEAEDPSKIMVLSSSPHDVEGEGEEDEETTHQIKSHVYKMIKGDKGSSWGDMGVGMLRLKKHKDNGTRRMLLRNSGTGKITINFNIYAGMNPTVSEKTVSFMGHEDSKSTPYKLRLKTADQASELKNAIDREIEFVKSKSE